MKKVKIIAEAGVNHNGSVATAIELIDAAAAAGADYVKFQTFKAENLVTPSAKKAVYQIQNTGEADVQYDMLKKLELSFEDFRSLKAHCDKRQIKFISTPFDHESIHFLNSLGMDFFKVPSGEITNYLYLQEIASTGKAVILSTGMCTMEEVIAAVQIFRSKGYGAHNLTVLHCTTEYPAPFDEINLNVLDTMRKSLDLPIGYSDHSAGIEISLAAAALGAVIIEKHFTLDRSLPGPDHKASIEPHDLKLMIDSIKNITIALGSKIKAPTSHELSNLSVARKSLVAIRPIKKGEILTIQNVGAKRPGNGLSPMLWPTLEGKPAAGDFSQNELITL